MLSFDEFKKEWGGKKCAVLGIGISNIPLIAFLLSAGLIVTARDKKSENELGDLSVELREKGVTLITGKDYLAKLGDDEDIIFKTPGMRFDIPELLSAAKKGAYITSEMQLFFEMCPCHIIGITGSDGKTTTTTLVSEMLKKDGKTVYVGGNIGRPLLPLVRNMKSDDYAVVELSSFQLQTMKSVPEIAVITNITPNHLDYHKGMDEYVSAKYNILSQGNVKRAVLNAENEYTLTAKAYSSGECFFFSSKNKADIYKKDGTVFCKDTPILKTSQIKIPGEHNVENYMAAIGALFGIVSTESMVYIAQTFSGVEHRCEFVRELNRVKYYNSSIDSSPTRTLACLSAFNRKIIAILGGYDKNLDYSPLGSPLCEMTKAVILTGNTAQKIKNAVLSSEKYKTDPLAIYEVSNLKEAVKKASEIAKEDDIVVLTPASASFDSFKNFEERGRYFKKSVCEL